MKILFITSSDPTKLVGGGATATRSLIAAMKAAPLSAQVEMMYVHQPEPRQPRMLRQIAALLRSLTSPLPSKSLFDLPPGTSRFIREAIARIEPDWTVFDGVPTYALAFEHAQECSPIVIAHNAEGNLYDKQTSRLRKLPIVGRFFRRDLKKLQRLERDVLRGAQRIVALSAVDEQLIKDLAPGSRTLVLPTTFAYPPFERREPWAPNRPLRISFLAKYSWWPNREAVEWLIGNVLDKLPSDAVRVNLFGPGAERFADAHTLIDAKGSVSDLSEVWEQTDIFICPMISGSGINIKFIEALYNRQPVLATPFTQRGLEPVDDPAVRFLTTGDEWAGFLASDEAMQLARKRPAPEISDRFSHRGAADRLAAFLQH